MSSVSEPSLFPKLTVVISYHTLWHQVRGGSGRWQRPSTDKEKALLLVPREASSLPQAGRKRGKNSRDTQAHGIDMGALNLGISSLVFAPWFYHYSSGRQKWDQQILAIATAVLHLGPSEDLKTENCGCSH